MFFPFIIIILLLDFFFQRSLGFQKNQVKMGMGKTRAQIARAEVEAKKKAIRLPNGWYSSNETNSSSNNSISNISSTGRSSSSSSSSVQNRERHNGTLPSCEDIDTNGYLGPKCVPNSAFHEDFYDEEDFGDNFSCDDESCFHD